MIRNLFGGSKCRTIDVCDIFGDGSGKALYRLDGNANDESGNYHGTETAITYGGGVYERGAVFNGSSGYITSGYTALASSTVSFSCWVNTTVNAGTKPILWDGTGSTATTRGAFGFEGTKFAIFIGNGSTGWFDNSTVDISGLQNGAWHHIVVAISGTTVKLYTDGALAYTYTSSISLGTAGSTPYYIGKFGTSAGYFNGSIDQVRIFNRAVTATEVATLYAECAPTSTVDNINPFEDGSLKALYQFNGDATDKTGGTAWTTSSMVYSSGKFGQCADFTTSAPTATLPASVFNTYSGGFCITAWINLTNVTSSDGVMCTSMAGGNYFIAPIRVEAGYVFASFGLAGTSSINTPTTSLAVKVNTWHFVCFRFNSDKTIQMSLDGGVFTTKTSASGYNLSQVVNNLMLFNNGTTDYATGKIDQLRIFNKALTPMEVASLYNETTPLEEPMHSLVDPFKDGSGKALYRLDGNALDESGNYNGTATSVTYGTGRTGRCGVFSNATDDYIDIGSSILNQRTNGGFSLSAWVRRETANSLQEYVMDDRTTAGASENVLEFLLSSTLYLDVYFTDGTSSTRNITYSGSSDANWHHYVLATNGSTFVDVYADGVKLNSFNMTGKTIRTQTVPLTIGKDAYHGTAYDFNGRVDQLRMFNRALTQAEVTQLYTQGA